MNEKNEKTWAAVVHLGGLAGLILHIGFANLIGVLILWLLKRHESAFVDEQGKEALNFQITICILFIIGNIIFWGSMGMNWWHHNYWGAWFHNGWWGGATLLRLIQLYNLAFCIIAAISAGQGKHYRYPLSLRLVK